MATSGAGGGSGGEDVVINFGASFQGVIEKIQQMSSAFKGLGDNLTKEIADRSAAAFGVFGSSAEKAAQQFLGKWAELPPALRAVGTAVAGLGLAVAAGMGAIKAAQANAEMVEATRDFARALGITTNEATVLGAALADVGASQGEFEAAAKGLSRQLKSNEDDMQRFGLVTRDAAGNLRPLNDLMVDAIRVVNSYEQGTDRNIAAQTLLGRSVDSSSRLLMLNRDTIQQNRQAVQELNLEVGESAVRAWEDYDAASDRAALTMKAFGKAIQESVLPIATELTTWFNSLAPAAITVLRGALGGLTTVFLGVTNGVRVLWETINAMVITVAEPIRGLAEAIYKAATGDFQGAADAIRGISSTISGAWETAFDKILESSQSTKDRIAGVWAFATGGNMAPGASGAADGSRKAPPKPADAFNANRLAVMKQENDAALALQLEYLRQEQVILESAHQQELLGIEEFYRQKQELDDQAAAFAIAAKQREAAEVTATMERLRAEAATKSSPEEKNKLEDQATKLQAQQVRLLGEIAVLQEKRKFTANENAMAAERETRALRDRVGLTQATAVKDAKQGDIDKERARIDQMRSLRQIDADQALELQRQNEARSFAATTEFLERKRELLRDADLAGRAELNAEVEAAEREHQQRLTQIDMTAELERRQFTMQGQEAVQQSFGQMISSLLSGTTKVSDAFRQFAFNVAKRFEDMIGQRFAERLFGAGSAGGDIISAITEPIAGAVDTIVRKWILGQTAMTSATTAGVAARTTAEEVGAGESLIISAGAAIKRIAIAAWVAAAEVYQSIAAIPYVGPFLAPAMAIAAVGAVFSFAKNIASAEGGWWEIPGDQMAMVHKNEMVLPAKEASGLRELVSAGRGMSSGGGGAPVQLQGVQAGKFFVAATDDLQRVLAGMSRDFRR